MVIIDRVGLNVEFNFIIIFLLKSFLVKLQYVFSQ